MTGFVEVSVSALSDVSKSLRDYRTDLVSRRSIYGSVSGVTQQCSREIDTVKCELRDIELDLAAAENELDKYNSELSYTENELDNEYAREAQLEDEIAGYEQDKAAAEAWAYKSEQEAEFHAGKADTPYPDDSAYHQAAYNTAVDNYNAAVGDADLASKRLYDAQEELKRVQGRIYELNRDIDRLQGLIYEKEQDIAALNDRKYRMEDKISRMESALSKLESDIAYYQSEIDRYVSSSESVADRLINATEQCIRYIEIYDEVRLI